MLQQNHHHHHHSHHQVSSHPSSASSNPGSLIATTNSINSSQSVQFYNQPYSLISINQLKQQNQQPPSLNQPQAIITNENLNYVFAIGYAVKLRPHLFIKQPAFLEVTKNECNAIFKKIWIERFFFIVVLLHKSIIHKQTWKSTRQRGESVVDGWNFKIEKSSLGAYISVFSNEWLHSTPVNMQYPILGVRERN